MRKEPNSCMNCGCYFKVDQHSDKGPICGAEVRMWNIKYDMCAVHGAYLSPRDALIPLLAPAELPPELAALTSVMTLTLLLAI